VVNGYDRTPTSSLTRIDVAPKRAVRTFDLDAVVPVDPQLRFPSLAAGLGAAWVITWDAWPGPRQVTGALWRVDPSGRVERTLTLRDPPPVGVAVAAGSVWVGHRRIRRIDPRTRAVVATIEAAGIVVAAGEGAVWAVGGQTVREALSEMKVLKIDPGTNSIHTSVSTQRNTGPGGQAPLVAAGEGAVWIGVGTVRLRSVVYRVDPFSGEIAGAFTFASPVSGMAAGLGSVWVTSAVSGTLSRVDPSSGEIVVLDFGKTQPTGVAVGEGLVWVAVS
jgi:streptogramin lyase